MLTRRLLAKEVLGLCGFGRAEGLLGLPGVLGAESMPMLCLLVAAVDGGVFSLILTQSLDCAGDEKDGWRIPVGA